jgi:hypothetical protein
MLVSSSNAWLVVLLFNLNRFSVLCDLNWTRSDLFHFLDFLVQDLQWFDFFHLVFLILERRVAGLLECLKLTYELVITFYVSLPLLVFAPRAKFLRV